MTAFVFIITAVLGYVCGSVNPAIIISKLVYGEDIRTKGSGNPGFTNFKRVYGNSFISWSVMFLDIFKTAIAVFISALIFKSHMDAFQFGAAYAGLFAMLGHCFPVWYGFKGGKAFMAGFATTWFVDYRMSLIAMCVFFLVLAIWKYMSLASCLASITCPVALFFLKPDMWVTWVICLVSALLVVVRHRSNFVKLKNGTESKFHLKSK